MKDYHFLEVMYNDHEAPYRKYTIKYIDIDFYCQNRTTYLHMY